VEPPAPPVPLSVVTPTWNEARHLEALARSLAEQAALHEWIVSDGESPDGSAELAARLGARVLRGARGRGAQLARGAQAARGELLCFRHADARLAPGALAAVAEAFADPAVCAAGMRQRIEHPARFYRWIERAADRRVARGRVYGDSALCVRRAAYVAAGGFRAQPVFEDLDLARRLRRLGRIVLVRDALVLCSPRRWEREGRLRRTLQNWALTALWSAGVDPSRLARFYTPHAER
jgi:rSAM/selenodomain-associated transferase 2